MIMIYINSINQGPMNYFSNKLNISFYFYFFTLLFVTIFATEIIAETQSFLEESTPAPGIATFSPPKGWLAADKNVLSEHVKILVVGPKIKNDMPPTMNLMIEPYNGTLKTYLKSVKKINDAHGDAWKDLGTLKTKSGEASLSQVEIRSKWGGEKLMHAIIVKNGYAYVLTASAAKNEFGRFYQQFYSSLRSLQIYDHVLDLISDVNKKKSIENAFQKIANNFKEEIRLQSSYGSTPENIFSDANFQNNDWIPFLNMLKSEFKDLGEDWQNSVAMSFKEKLLKEKN